MPPNPGAPHPGPGQPGPGHPGPQQPGDTRDRAWPGAFNARDLAGLPVVDGHIRAGVLFRSGQPQAWADAGWRAAHADGVRRIVDLRDEREPRGLAESRDGIAYTFAPVEDPTLPAFRARFTPYMNHPSGYADFTAMFSDRIAAAVGSILAAGPGTLICCAAGRDRTGLVSSILLLALGADAETLVAEDARATRAVNEHHLHREKPHPYEHWVDDNELALVVADRAQALRAFVAEFDALRMLAQHGIDAGRICAARDWAVAETE